MSSVKSRRLRPKLEELTDRCVPAQTAVLVADIHVGSGATLFGPNSNPTHLANVNGTLFFAATDGTNGIELWKSDGTPEGTNMVRDINSGPRSSRPTSLTAVGNLVYFIADGGDGRRLYRSDGTAGNTTYVGEFTGHALDFSDFSELTVFNGDLFFKARANMDTGPTGLELWRVKASDGLIHPGPVAIPGGAIDPSHLTVVHRDDGSSLLFFAGNTEFDGRELWRSDGTIAGTFVPKDIRSGVIGSIPRQLTASGGELFFVADDGPHGRELWKSDGTPFGTRLVHDIRRGVTSTFTFNGNAWLTDFEGALFFSANNGTDGDELWKAVGGQFPFAVKVAEIRPGSNGSAISSMVNVNGVLYFSATDGTNGHELWKSDGTPTGTVLVKNIRPNGASSSPSWLTNVNGTLYFAANDGANGMEPWISDGTDAGTRMLANVRTGLLAGSSPTWLTDVNGVLYFAANNRRNGNELWRSRENELHTIFSPGNQSGAEGDAVSLPIEVDNPDGDPLTFSAINLPPGLSINASTGDITGTVGAHAGRTQPYQVRISATDGFETATVNFNWSVSDSTLPAIFNPGPQGNNEGNTLGSLRINATDPEGDPLTFRAEGLPDGLQMGIILNPNYGVIYGTIGPRAALNGNLGNPRDGVYQVTVYANDGYNETGTMFLWTIGDVTAPVFDNPGPQRNNEGNQLGLWVSANDAEGDSFIFRATGLPPGLILLNSPTSNMGVITGTLSPRSAGEYDVTVTADDGHNISSVTFHWTVGDLNPPTVQHPGTQSDAAGSSVSLQIVADDSDNDPLAYSSVGLPPGLALHPDTGVISGIIDPSAAGSFHVTVFVTDGTSTAQTSFVWNITGSGAGRLDETFSEDGLTTTNFINDDERAYATAVQANGKIVVAGTTQSSIDGVQRDIALTRYNDDGTLDETFGPGGPDGDGKVTTNRSIEDEARAVVMQGNEILVAGFIRQATTDFALLRYKSLGGLDTEFGPNGDGIVLTNFGDTDRATAIALQPDGKIVVGGITDLSGTTDFALARFDADGFLDLSFGLEGMVVTDIGGADELTGLVVQPDGAIVAAGTSRLGGVEQFVAVRYLSSGELDRTFGQVSGSERTGIALIDIADTSSAAGLALRTDGHILLAGTSYDTASGFNFTLAMLETDGDLDGTFGVGGVVRTDLPGVGEQARAVTFQADGRILLAGRAGSGPNADFAVVRYTAAGALDPSFSSDGIVMTDISGEDDLFGIALDGDRLVAVGGSNNGGDEDFAVARYLL